MRLATIGTGQGTSAARLEGDELVLLRSRDVKELLGAPSLEQAAHDETGESVSLGAAKFATLIPRPGKVFCVGLNYRSHILETGAQLPEYPTFFAKFSRALIGAHDDIVLPSNATGPDWEVELAIVIGRPVRHVGVEEARAAIAGYTIVNDITMRDWQRRTVQWLQGKTFESTTPVGPFLVSGDEVGDALDLEVRCEVDGEVMQQDRTSELVFGPAECVAYASEIITLEPGDIISTGTTGGVGWARTPPVFLAPGQQVRTMVEGLGECRNTCVAEQR
jgi:acylpyruvate hydrolase